MTTLEAVADFRRRQMAARPRFVVGVDLSSYRIDLAWVNDDGPERWHQVLAKPRPTAHKDYVPVLERIRAIEVPWMAIRYDRMDRGPWGALPGTDVTDLVIEYPFGNHASSIAPLMAVVGALTKDAPRWMAVHWPAAQKLRKAIGAKNTKDDAVKKLRELPWLEDYFEDWDEHELDALVAAVGGRAIIEASEQGD